MADAHLHYKGSDKSCRKTHLTWFNPVFTNLFSNEEPFIRPTTNTTGHTLGDAVPGTGELSKGLKRGSEGFILCFPKVPSNYLNNKRSN